MKTVKEHLATLDVPYFLATVNGQEYCVVYGTGERSYGKNGGELAFAYKSDNEALTSKVIATYQSFCDTFCPESNKELAELLAADSYRLTNDNCDPVLSDDEYAAAR